ncbi:MAG: ankyrin repeat domain-containing protein [Verrucomicrobium sp.]|nr:ankyrin repeat domain-containing protein [Verrucomicrobium sp.]
MADAPEKTALPLSRETEWRIYEAITEYELLPFAEKHQLTHAHFLLKSNKGYTPLHWAARYGCLNQVASILEDTDHPLSSKDLSLRDSAGDTLYYWVAMFGHFDQAAAILNQDGETLSLHHLLTHGSRGRTPLHQAAEEGHLDQIASLLSPGQKLTPEHLLLPDGDGWTSLHAMASNGHLGQAVAILGPQLTAQHFLTANDAGRSVLSTATHAGNLEQIFQPGLWQGRIPEMLQLWEQVPEESRSQIDFGQIADETLHRSLPSLPRLERGVFHAAARASLPGVEAALPPQKTKGR